MAHTHTCGHIQTQTHQLTQAPLVSCFSGEYEAAGRGDGGQYCLSLSLYKSAGICTHGPAKSVSISALGTLPPPLPCVLALGYSISLAGARPQVMLLSVFIAGQLAPQSHENHLKVLKFEGGFLI